MYFLSKKKKTNWQRKFVNDVFKKSKEEQSYSKIVLKNLDILDDKNEYMPCTLFKYFRPTSENILDIKNQRLWMANPKSFNDPFDCNVGYNKDDFEKKKLFQIINETGCVDNDFSENGITREDWNRLYRSKTDDIFYWNSKNESFFDAKRKVFETKSEEFQRRINTKLNDAIREADKKISYLKSSDIRISCFSKFERHNDFPEQIVMWSHYADNHKGFCIEYDLSFLSQSAKIEIPDIKFYEDSSTYLDERNRILLKAGLFPVEYSSKRINIPYSKLERFFINTAEKTSIKNLDDLLFKAYLVKSANWNYEKEWRIILDNNICNYYDNKIPFPYAKRIFVGCKADKELINTMIDIGKEIKCEVILLKMDGKRFVLEERGTWEIDYEKSMRKIKNPYSKY